MARTPNTARVPLPGEGEPCDDQHNLKRHWGVYSAFRWLPFRLCPVVFALMPEMSNALFLEHPYCVLQSRVLGRVEEEKWSGWEKPSVQSDPALPGM